MYTKSVRKKLSQLAGLAYERELGKNLEKLLGHFEEWKKGKLESSELSDLIHKFHNGASRDVYLKYQHLDKDALVAAAFVSGLISEEELTEPIKEQIKSRIEFYTNQV